MIHCTRISMRHVLGVTNMNAHLYQCGKCVVSVPLLRTHVNVHSLTLVDGECIADYTLQGHN